MRRVILIQDETGTWVAEIPSLPGCISQGATRDEALRNIGEAADLWIETMQDLKRTIPTDDRGVEVAVVQTAA